MRGERGAALDEQDGDVAPRQLDGGREAGRAGAGDEDGRVGIHRERIGTRARPRMSSGGTQIDQTWPMRWPLTGRDAELRLILGALADGRRAGW